MSLDIPEFQEDSEALAFPDAVVFFIQRPPDMRVFEFSKLLIS
jgi:hypothetical protein